MSFQDVQRKKYLSEANHDDLFGVMKSAMSREVEVLPH
jgi:hypothetical protein